MIKRAVYLISTVVSFYFLTLVFPVRAFAWDIDVLLIGPNNSVWGHSTSQCSPTNWVDVGYNVNVSQSDGSGTPSWLCGWTYAGQSNQPYFHYQSNDNLGASVALNVIPSVDECDMGLINVPGLGCVFFRRYGPGAGHCLGANWCSIGAASDYGITYPADGSDYIYSDAACDYIVGRNPVINLGMSHTNLPVKFGIAGANSCTFV